MGGIPEEKRSYSRLKSSLKIGVSDKVLGDTVDLSEGGLSFNSAETIASPVIPLQIHFPGKEFKFKTKAKLVWNRDIDGGVSSYGVEFVNLSEARKAVLRKELITMQAGKLLDDIGTPGIKKQILDFFLKDILNYVGEITEISLC
ncbi:MAG: PilZ domain-containing protein, partial [Candidatus Omnitrophica bacterium]|nr:PilZ domain-containing protein [Candidatus Omnitrophota bacterium]